MVKTTDTLLINALINTDTTLKHTVL